MRRLTHLIVLVAFVFSCGGQWYALQGVAWVKMLHDYSQVVPFSEAVSMTFSGQYPCEICKAIAEKKNSDQQKSFTLDQHEKKFFPPLAIAVASPGDSPLHYLDFAIRFQSRTDAPPTPPPRLVLS